MHKQVKHRTQGSTAMYSLSLSLCMFVHVYVCVFVCVCVHIVILLAKQNRDTDNIAHHYLNSYSNAMLAMSLILSNYIVSKSKKELNNFCHSSKTPFNMLSNKILSYVLKTM